MYVQNKPNPTPPKPIPFPIPFLSVPARFPGAFALPGRCPSRSGVYSFLINPTPLPQKPPFPLPLPFPPRPLPRVPIPSPRTAPARKNPPLSTRGMPRNYPANAPSRTASEAFRLRQAATTASKTVPKLTPIREPPCSPKSSPFGPVRPARARSSHASRCSNPDFGASEAAPGTVRGCYIVLHGAFDIVAFARSKFVHNFRRKIDYPCTNRDKIDVQNDAKIDPKPRLSLFPPLFRPTRCLRYRRFWPVTIRSQFSSKIDY